MTQDLELKIKGYRGGVLITLPVIPWHAQRDLLIRRIQSQESFFKGGRIALDVGESVWTEAQLARLLRDLSDEGVCLWAILSLSEETKLAAESYDIPTSIRTETDGEKKAKTPSPEPHHEWLFRNIETGDSFESQGNLCLIGNLQEGASLKVEGSLVLWGKAAGSIELYKPSCPHLQVHILEFEQAQISFNGENVEGLDKVKSGTRLSIVQKDGKLVIEKHKTKRFGIL